MSLFIVQCCLCHCYYWRGLKIWLTNSKELCTEFLQSTYINNYKTIAFYLTANILSHLFWIWSCLDPDPEWFYPNLYLPFNTFISDFYSLLFLRYKIFFFFYYLLGLRVTLHLMDYELIEKKYFTTENYDETSGTSTQLLGGD